MASVSSHIHRGQLLKECFTKIKSMAIVSGSLIFETDLNCCAVEYTHSNGEKRCGEWKEGERHGRQTIY